MNTYLATTDAQRRFRLVTPERTPAQWTDLYLRAAEGAAAAGDLQVLQRFLHEKNLSNRVHEHMPLASNRLLQLHKEEGRLADFEIVNGSDSALDPTASYLELARWMREHVTVAKAGMESVST